MTRGLGITARSRWLLRAGLFTTWLFSRPCVAQGPLGHSERDSTSSGSAPVNFFSFILGVDVPESPAFVALGISPTGLRSGSAPKPLALHVQPSALGDLGAGMGLSFDASPYFLLGGGPRSLGSYTSMTIGGRLMRVLTKTIVSAGAMRVPGQSQTPFGFGVRSTFHDPHDVISAMDSADIHIVMRSATNAANYDPEAGVVLAKTGVRLRAASANPQVSGGWGMATQVGLNGSVVPATYHPSHLVWLSTQFTLGPLVDLVVTPTLHSRTSSHSYVTLGTGFEHQLPSSTLLLGGTYTTRTRRESVEVSLDVRLAGHLGIVGSLATQSPSFADGPIARLVTRLEGHWFYATDTR